MTREGASARPTGADLTGAEGTGVGAVTEGGGGEGRDVGEGLTVTVTEGGGEGGERDGEGGEGVVAFMSTSSTSLSPFSARVSGRASAAAGGVLQGREDLRGVESIRGGEEGEGGDTMPVTTRMVKTGFDAAETA